MAHAWMIYFRPLASVSRDGMEKPAIAHQDGLVTIVQ